jgi:selenide,water dikinase
MAKEQIVRLTQYSHGSGCGCKIAPADLERILVNARNEEAEDPRLLVGNGTSDDAAVVDIGNGKALITTTDFFMPIVDDAFHFGRIAASNAISDVYAMGGTPLTAIAILGWPVEQLSPELAAEVISGAKSVCKDAGISLSGGHSIDSKEPFFGLAVTGMVDHAHVKQNVGASPGDLLYLTKPIGVGILATAIKRNMLEEAVVSEVIEAMAGLNKVGSVLGTWPDVHAMTDVTGFGLLGHLIEMCEGSEVSASIRFDELPLIAPTQLNKLMEAFVMPDNTMRNFKAFSSKVSKLNARQLQLLCDPQTSGGLLMAVAPDAREKVHELLSKEGLYPEPIGVIEAPSALRVNVV